MLDLEDESRLKLALGTIEKKGTSGSYNGANQVLYSLAHEHVIVVRNGGG